MAGHLASSISLGGTAVVCCIHGVEKNRVLNLVHDAMKEKATQCVCCGNCFAYDFDRSDAPLLCSQCDRGGKNG
jgi:hypothetical protein